MRKGCNFNFFEHSAISTQQSAQKTREKHMFPQDAFVKMYYFAMLKLSDNVPTQTH
jgi:hypothetical protein